MYYICTMDITEIIKVSDFRFTTLHQVSTEDGYHGFLLTFKDAPLEPQNIILYMSKYEMMASESDAISMVKRDELKLINKRLTNRRWLYLKGKRVYVYNERTHTIPHSLFYYLKMYTVIGKNYKRITSYKG
jgi:hypothetical protein